MTPALLSFSGSRVQSGFLFRLGPRLFSLIVICAVGIPFIPLFFWSFTAKWFYPDLWPQAWGVRAWNYVFGIAGEQILSAFWQSFFVAGITTLFAVVIGLPAARVLAFYDFRGKDLISMALIAPIVVPPLSTAMGLHLWFLKLALAETFFGVVLVHLTLCLPYTIFVLRGVFSNYNPEFEEQARSLGIPMSRVIFRVMLPMTLPGIIVAALFSFLLSWSQYLGTLIIGGGRIITLPMMLFSLMGGGDRPVAAAVSLIFILPVLGALVVSARYLGGRGMTGMW